MEIIGMEGLDKSGKHSQCKLLKLYLEALGYKVAYSEFHRYDTPTGKLIMEWLSGRWNTDQKTIELIMSADKQAQQGYFDELEEAGTDYLILDRYTLSQLAYSTCNGIEPAWAMSLQQYMRKPDIQILIDIPAEISMSRQGKHNDGINDRYESNKDLLDRVRKEYRRHITLTPNSFFVDGLQSIENVHVDILTKLQPYLKK